ncbi:MAG TPA: cytochrome c [Longimicrobiales bacterium]
MKTIVLGVLLLACAHTAQAQQSTLTVDKKLAAAGKTVFAAKGCNACHTIGKGALVGPDLNGVLARRSQGWIERWLADPPAMLESDSTARLLRKDYSINMPNLGLKPEEIRALMHYIAAQSKTAPKQ